MHDDVQNADIDCRFCGEAIKFFDEKCGHCGERLREKAGPEWDGDVVVVPDMGQLLTDDCVLCGAKNAPPKDLEFQHRPVWVPIVSGILIPFYCVGLFVYLFLNAILRKGGQITARVCHPCRRLWVGADIAFAMLVVVGAFGLPIGGILAAELWLGPHAEVTGFAAGLFAYVIFAVVSYVFMLKRLVIRCVGIEPHVSLRLRFPRPGLLRRLLRERRERRERE